MRSNFVTQFIRQTVLAGSVLMTTACAFWSVSPFVDCRENKYGELACYREETTCFNFQCRTRRIRVSDSGSDTLVAELKVNDKSALTAFLPSELPKGSRIRTIEGNTASARVEFASADTKELEKFYKTFSPSTLRTLEADSEGLTIEGVRYQSCEVGASTEKGDICIKSLQIALPKDAARISHEAPQG